MVMIIIIMMATTTMMMMIIEVVVVVVVVVVTAQKAEVPWIEKTPKKAESLPQLPSAAEIPPSLASFLSTVLLHRRHPRYYQLQSLELVPAL